MPTIDEARSALIGARNVLVGRLDTQVPDPQEQQAIADAIAQINLKIKFLNQASLLQAAQAVSEAAGLLQKVVDSAQTDPVARFVRDIQGAIEGFSKMQSSMAPPAALATSAPAAAAPGAATPGAAAPGAATPTSPVAAPSQAAGSPAAAPSRRFKPINSTSFAALRQEYQTFFDACTARPEHAREISNAVARLAKNRNRYEAVGKALGIPWQFIGVIHGLEGNFDFGTHLHNGDSLQARTVNEPKGRPPAGVPPFSWEDSAVDALVFQGFGSQADWSVPRMLFRWETFNGFGYRPLGIPSPYLWSFSNLYERGKFTSDNHFDPTVASRQCGAAVMLKAVALQAPL